MNEGQVIPFVMEDALDVMNATPEHIPWLVENLLLEVGLSMLVGKPKTGKSTFVRQLSVAVSEGLKFLARETLASDVLYFVLEGPKGVVGHHLKKLGYTGAKKKIRIVYEPMPYQGDLGLKKLEATLALPQNADVRLVIIDPVKKFLRTADSNNPDEVSLALEKLEDVAKKFSVHIMFLTHAKKRVSDDSGDAAIGATNFRGGTDTNMLLVKKPGGERTFETEQRWGIGIEPTFVHFDEERGEISLGQLVEDAADSARERRLQETRARIEKEIWDVIAAIPSATQKDILAGVQGKTTTILDVLNSMILRNALGKVALAGC